MPRPCPSCNKLASLDWQEPETDSIDVDENGTITGTVRVYATSACCGEEMKEYVFEPEIEPADDLAEHVAAHVEAGEEYSLSVHDDDPSLEDRTQTKDRKGNPIKSHRYMRTYRGYSLTGTVECDCGESFPFEITEEEQASAFEEIA